MWLTRIFLCATMFVCASADTKRGYILTAPHRLLANTMESVCISLHSVPGSAHVKLQLLHSSSEDIYTTVKHTMQKDTECLELFVPQIPENEARLRLLANFDQLPDYSINNTETVQIQHKSGITVIQTDKSVYKPGQLVRIRILVVNHELKPLTYPISKVWIESPSQVRLAQWLEVKTLKGLAHLEFQLSSEPIMGQWYINVEHQNASSQREWFTVKEYVLPRFEVIITPPSFILTDSKLLTWKICAKYSYGLPVKGRVHIKARTDINAWMPTCGENKEPVDSDSQCFVPPSDINAIGQVDNCYLLNLTGEELGLQTEYGTYHGHTSSVTISATVTEANTDLERNASVTTHISKSALNLQIQPMTSQYFKLGLPYNGKLEAKLPKSTQWRGVAAPAPGEPIELCMKVQTSEFSWEQTPVSCRNMTTDSNGTIYFTIPPHQNTSIKSYTLTATALNYETKYYSPERRWMASMYQPTASIRVQEWYSPSKNYIQVLDQSKETPRCNYHHTFTVQFVQPDIDSLPVFHYMVKSRGDLITSGQIHALPVPSQPSEDNIIGSELMNDTLQSAYNQINQFGLKILITPKMSPESKLLVYYVREDGETVATTYQLKIEQCYGNKVSARWQKEKVAPGSQSVLHLAAAPSSLCSISAVDKSTRFLAAESRSLTGSSILDRIAVFSNDDQVYQFDVNYCNDSGSEHSRRRRSSMPYYGFHASNVDAQHAFDEFGVIVMTDLAIKTKRCIPNPWTQFRHVDNMLGSVQLERQNPQPAFAIASASGMGAYGASAPMPTPGVAVERRTYFPETWLWELVSTEKTGRAQIRSEVPHTITDWVGSAVCISSQQGVGISEPMHLTAYQPFFVELALPYSIKRSEVVHIKVALYNFLSHGLPVKITFEPSPGVELLSDDTSVSECVAEQANWVHRFRVKATQLGELNLTITAEVDAEFPKNCGPEDIVYRRDVLVKPVLVKPEGFPVEITKSAFVCPSNEDKILKWDLKLPTDLVEGSARAQVNVAADLMGPAMENLDKLVQMPMGCGEQNMVLFVPNLQVVNYLASTHQYNPTLRASAIKNMEKGYQRELNYRHEDGSYSAFGKSDPEGSMWLTAFVVKTFAQVKSHIFVDEADLKISLDWISKKQLENGCFPVVGTVLHKGMKGGLSEDRNGTTSALTAYVLISLLETGMEIPATLKSEAIHCIMADPQPDTYTLALTAYALSLLDNQVVALQALHRLMAVATTKQDLLSWEKPGSNSLAMTVEMTAYAILSLVKIGGPDNLVAAHKAVRWMSQHRNSKGGFISTQDTVVGLEAMSKFAASLPDGDTLLNVRVTAADFQHNFHIQPHDRLVQQRQMLPTLPTEVEIVPGGEGCVLVQSWLRYNVHTARGDDALEMMVNMQPHMAAGACVLESQVMEACVRYKPDNQSSNMALLEVTLPSGFIADRESLLALDNNKDIKRWDTEKDQVNLYFDALTNEWICLSFMVQQETKVENPVPSNAHLYDYYQPEVTISESYQLATACAEEPLPSPMPMAFQLPIIAKKIQDLEIQTAITTSEQTLTEEKRSLPDSEPVDEINTNVTPDEEDNLQSPGLNPDFVNVDFELETPDGEEGPAPVVAEPPTSEIPEARQLTSKDDGSCPRCWAKFPGNFSRIYCGSTVTYKAVWRKSGIYRLLLDLTPSRTTSLMKRLVKIQIPESCICPPLQEENGDVHVLIVLADEPQSVQELNLNSSTNIWKLPVKQGQPQITKTARKKC